MHLGPISILLGQLIGMLCALFMHKDMLITPLRQKINADYSCIPMRIYVAQSLPFVPSMLCGALLASGDRWALAHLSSLHNVGIYSLANTLAQIYQYDYSLCANRLLYALSA